MRKAMIFAAAVALAGASIGGSVFAQGKSQTIGQIDVDVHAVAQGYRVSKLVGATVVNESNETVGSIEDLIVVPTDRVPFAIVSVGGFLGMGTKYVAVPYDLFQVHDKSMVLPGATKESLKQLPDFKFNT